MCDQAPDRPAPGRRQPLLAGVQLLAHPGHDKTQTVARPNKAILAEHWMYSRANLRRVVEVPTASHVVMLSHLNIVTDLIQDAARAST